MASHGLTAVELEESIKPLKFVIDVKDANGEEFKVYEYIGRCMPQ